MHIIDLDRDILGINKRLARRNHDFLKENEVFSVNIMGAIGSGKTALIEALTSKLGDRYSVGAIAGDVISDVDANRLKKLGIPVAGANTGKECHLDAHVVEHALQKLPLGNIDLLLIENVGNLICPTDFDLGEDKKLVIVSVSEGDDTVEKHPMIFAIADAAIINKIDIAGSVGADVQKMVSDALKIKPALKVFKTSIKTGEGLDEVAEWVLSLL
jgi:hydrogenase nickel incorporation protein HypB